MRRFSFACFIGLLLHSLGLRAAESDMPWFDQLPQSDHYKRVSTLEHVALENAFLSFFREQKTQQFSQFYQFQSHLRGAAETEDPVMLARSQSELGWGAWGYWKNAPNAVFLQIPHRFYDLNTDVFAEVAWQKKMVQMVMLNSIHRFNGQQQQPKINSDLSNARRSPLLAASEAWLAVNPEGLIVQLHGFSQAKRKSQRAAKADIILSHGSNDRFLNGTRLQRVQACLENELGVQVVRYPDQVGELGGTLNNVAKALKRWRKSEQFIHVEMSYSVRKQLAKDKQQAARVLQCILEANDS